MSIWKRQDIHRWVERYKIFCVLTIFYVHWAHSVFNKPVCNLAAESTTEKFQIFIEHA